MRRDTRVTTGAVTMSNWLLIYNVLNGFVRRA
jgi:hypothetical protein